LRPSTHKRLKNRRKCLLAISQYHNHHGRRCHYHRQHAHRHNYHRHHHAIVMDSVLVIIREKMTITGYNRI
jgi:hypothetical protein